MIILAPTAELACGCYPYCMGTMPKLSKKEHASMDEMNKTTDDSSCAVKKTYDTPELVELGNVSELTNYDVSTMVP